MLTCDSFTDVQVTLHPSCNRSVHCCPTLIDFTSCTFLFDSSSSSAQARGQLLFAFVFDCVTVPRRHFHREPRCGSPAWHTRARLKRAEARRLLRAHHGSAPPMSQTWKCGTCGRNNPPHRRKCQTWHCRERGPGQEDGGYWDCGCGCESNFASRPRCRSCGVVRGRYQQQQGQSGRKPQFTQSTFEAVVAEEAETQPVARTIRCPSASVPASTTAGTNPSGDAVAPLAFSLTAQCEDYRLGVRRKTTVGDFFGQSRDSNHIRTRLRPGNADGRSMASQAGPHGFSQ